MSVNRPVVSVYSIDTPKTALKSVAIPAVFQTPIRTDVVRTTHQHLFFNLRQPYAVNQYSGHQTSAESWGTGRAVSRIPRVCGGGTHRAGQGAFGNMCRKGRMFAPTKTFRRWQHKVSLNERRYAIASAIAASSVTPIVMAAGYRVEQIRELPFVVSDDLQSIQKTKEAAKALKTLNCLSQVVDAKNNVKKRSGKGKNRGRKWVRKLGPLIIYNENKGIKQAFRNLPGVQTLSVNRMNILRLAPGGHVGRFIIWTESAFNELNNRFGSYDGKSVQSVFTKRNGEIYRLPRTAMTNTDITRIIESEAVQNALKEKKEQVQFGRKKNNPLRNFRHMVKLNPNANTIKRQALLTKVGKESGLIKVDERKEKRDAKRKEIRAQFFKKYIEPLSQ